MYPLIPDIWLKFTMKTLVQIFIFFFVGGGGSHFSGKSVMFLILCTEVENSNTIFSEGG